MKNTTIPNYALSKENRVTEVCIVAPVHIWDDVRVFHKEAVSLAQIGYNVTLIAKIDGRKKKKDVSIIPVITSERSRILRFCLLPVVFFQALAQGAEVYHLHNPDTLPIGFLLKIFGKSVIYDTHEDFSRQVLMKDWLPKVFRKPIAKFVGHMERLAARIFDGTIATQETVLNRLGTTAKLIQNPPRTNPDLLKQVEDLKQEIEDPFPGFRLVYIGTIANSRGLDTMVEAMELLNRDFEARLWLIGKANEKELGEAQKNEGWQYVDYIPHLPQEKAFAHVALSDLGLIVIDDVGDHKQTDPNKIYEYMTFGVPFIASDFELWTQKLNDVDAGWFVQPEDPALLAEQVGHALSNNVIRKQFGKNARKFIDAYNWEKESAKLLNLYSQIDR